MISFVLVPQWAISSESPEECTRIDLRESPCLAKPKNQSDTEWCYAYSAAEVASFHLCQEVSPAALGLLRSDIRGTPDKFWLNGGWPEEALRLGNKYGYCLEKEIPSQKIVSGDVLSLRHAYLSLLAEAAPDTPNPVSANSGCNDHEMRGLSEILPLADTAAVIRFVEGGKNPKSLYELARASCKQKIQRPVPVDRCRGNAKSKLDFVDRSLPQGPVSMAGYTSAESRLFSGETPVQGSHAVTLIGREWDAAAKQCRYLVRDSAGPYRVGKRAPERPFSPHRWITQAELLQDLGDDHVRCIAAQSESGQGR